MNFDRSRCHIVRYLRRNAGRALGYWTVCLAGLLGASAHADTQNPIELLYTVRPPFMVQTGDTVGGLTGAPAVRAFEVAGIGYKLVEASPKRRLVDVQENKRRVCSMGFYVTDERKGFAKFTLAVSQDGPMVALANKELSAVKAKNLDTLLAAPDVKVLIKDAIVYGPFLEAQFAKMQAQPIKVTAEYTQLLRMVKARRADLLFLPAEEAAYYVNAAGYNDTDFQLLKLTGMPPGEYRHIMCSRMVDDSDIDKLNTAIGKSARKP